MLKKIKIPQNVSLVFLGRILKIKSFKEEFFFKILAFYELKIQKENVWFFFKFEYIVFFINVAKKRKHQKKISLFIILTKKIEQFLFGISTGFLNFLTLSGIGFKVILSNQFLFLKLGFSHLIKLLIPKEIKIFIPKENSILLKSSSKISLMNFIFLLHCLRKKDVYKNKGILFKEKKIETKKFKKK